MPSVTSLTAGGPTGYRDGMSLSDRMSPSARTAYRRALIVVACAIAVGVGVLTFSAAATAHRMIGPLEVGVRVAPSSSGQTVLSLPPFGSVSADTHAGPFSVTLSIDEVDMAALEDIVRVGVPSEEQARAWGDSLIAVVRLAAIKGLTAAIAAGLVVALAFRRSWRLPVAAAVLILAIVGGSLGVGVMTLDESAFLEPHFEGALSYAPAAFGMVQQKYGDVETLQEQLGGLARSLVAYYGASQSYAPAGELAGTMRVLHVSDLHLDPVGMQLVLELADAYGVDLIIDTGDITHFGTAQEAELAAAQLGDTPYIFVPGNHDSPAVRDALVAGGVTVLDRETTATATGLVVLGIGDPAGEETGVEPDSEAAAERTREALEEWQPLWDEGERAPDVVAVHHPAAGRAFAGLVQLVLSGHTHTVSYEEIDGTVLLGAGTTGGVHFTELRADPHIPHSASVLYFSREEPGRLVAIDQIEVYGKTRQSAIRRTVMDPELLADD